MSAPAPQVTVVTIVLDGERFLAEAVESVRAQTHADWELVLVDDGSSDRTPEIARAYAEADPRIRVVSHPGGENRGMSASRNLGVAAARGRYVAFLDADDVYRPGKLAHQAALLDAHPEADMVVGATEYWHSWQGAEASEADWTWRRFGAPTGAIAEPPTLLAQYLRDGGTLPCMGGLMVRREAVEAVGGFEAAFRGLFEDQAFLAKMALRSRIYLDDECHDRYRQHPASACRRATPDQTRAARDAYLAWLREYLTTRSDAAAVWKALRQAERGPRRRPFRTAYRTAAQAAGTVAEVILPQPLRQALGRLLRGEGYVPPPRWVRFGSLRRTSPLSRHFGYDRGLPVDRHYIEAFLDRHRLDVQGRVLEIGDDAYTRRFGGARVTQSDVLHIDSDHPRATIVADLANAAHIPDDAFDAIICTQTLHLIYKVPAALQTLARILAPGGTLLLTAPGISPVDRGEWGDTWYWSFTVASLRRLTEAVFPADLVHVEAHGNVLAASAFLYGLAAHELRPRELEPVDPSYPLVVVVRAQKPETP